MVLVTPDAMVARELVRSATDLPLRRALTAKGAEFVTEHAVLRWTGSMAEVVNLLTGETRELAADGLVLATGNRADGGLRHDLRAWALRRK